MMGEGEEEMGWMLEESYSCDILSSIWYFKNKPSREKILELIGGGPAALMISLDEEENYYDSRGYTLSLCRIEWED
jgi:hypothetical protein